MATVAARAHARPAEEEQAAEQVGAPSFSDLVRAHFRREQELQANGAASPATDEEYRARLAEFEREEGELSSVYWSTRKASAVAITVKTLSERRHLFAETEVEVRLHRVTDWVTKNAEPIAELLHECDLLAIRAGEILRGTSERIALQWIYSVQEHVLGFIERTDRRDAAKERDLVASQRRELSRIEQYYLRAGAKTGRIVYVSGMLTGATFLVTACALISVGLAIGSDYGGRKAQLLVLCAGAGAVGALVSVLARMGTGGGQFTVDFEVGRPLLRRLGLYKPFVGAIFGVALYFLLASGLLRTQPPNHSGTLFFYGIIAFFAGFSERFTSVTFGQAEQLITGESPPAAPPPADPPTDAAST
ncbi:MAG: hypothetical protein E6F97_02535 [Actinobacteria bacterium]|nr:MAG: hypothetical protein E6F97_02535 [Actinomycetota bacterium]